MLPYVLWDLCFTIPPSKSTQCLPSQRLTTSSKLLPPSQMACPNLSHLVRKRTRYGRWCTRRNARRLTKHSTDILMPCSGTIVEILLAVCSIFAKESSDWVACVLIYPRSTRQIIFCWLSSRSSCNDLLQNSNIISTFFKFSFSFRYCIWQADNNLLVNPTRLPHRGQHATLPRPQSSRMPTIIKYWINLEGFRMQPNEYTFG
jgi:hypothetical protein